MEAFREILKESYENNPIQIELYSNPKEAIRMKKEKRMPNFESKLFR